MKLSGSKLTMGVMALVISAASVVFAIGNGDRVVVGAASTPNDVVVQTMDSCKTPQNGAKYTLTGAGGSFTSTPITGSSTGSLSGPTCPVQQGSCSSTTKGCVVFHNVPAGDYRLVQVAVPGPNATNPDGYAPCNSGSGCQWETADVTVNSDGSVFSQVTNMAPTGNARLFPLPNDPSHAKYYAGTVDDPIVFHDFGLAKPGTLINGAAMPQCDGDGDADDWSTGTPGSNCQDPEASESSMCTNPTQFTTAAEGAQPSWSSTNFPWQCLTNPVATPAHLISAVLSGPSSVSALSTFQVNLLGGSTPTLVSTEDPGMTVVPNSMGFSVSLDPVRTVAGKHTVGGLVTTGTVTITPEGGQGNSLVVAVGLPSPNANYIENLYHDLLGRYGSAGEIGYWSTKMDQGMTRGQIAQTFSMTPEFLGHMIDADFQSMVGAAPAPSDPGRAFWVNFLLHGGNNDTIMGSLGAASNYYAQAGGTDAGFITSLYSKVLHRSTGPSPQDIQYWSTFGPFGGDANSGRRLQVANNFSFSTEQHRYVANG
ncbi:MAG TPA: DUF4214 domain-containing protein, partial [Candidatus Dormibacteraeota bacterium]|nr:DUF4214 domain-containing protein [Candidatus Dormibacteraeota bacterium]